MGCSGCSTSGSGKVGGCGSSGGCSTGGCNRLNTFDWLTTLDIDDASTFELAEITFRNGSRKEFFRNQPGTRATSGDYVLVESDNGYDIGKISLCGELARLQMKKKAIKSDGVFRNVIRKANERDLEKLKEIRSYEKPTMIQARAISKTLNIDMKVGDVEFQGDGRKATFYYTAEGRIDFRELIRHFAKDFRVKIEMRQIGVRQESAKIGGIGSCGRELCCSTWLTDFKSVSTVAARYQNLAINQSKLSGQCGRLKCCLNYELDTYMEALEQFPQNAERIRTAGGVATLVKTDIFKGLLFYGYDSDKSNKTYALEPAQVRSMQEMLSKGQMPPELSQLQVVKDAVEEEVGYEDVTGAVELPEELRRKKKKKKRPDSDRRENRSSEPRTPNSSTGQDQPAKTNDSNRSSGNEQRPPRNGNNNRNNSDRNSQDRNNPNRNNPNRNNSNRNNPDRDSSDRNKPENAGNDANQAPKPIQENPENRGQGVGGEKRDNRNNRDRNFNKSRNPNENRNQQRPPDADRTKGENNAPPKEQGANPPILKNAEGTNAEGAAPRKEQGPFKKNFKKFPPRNNPNQAKPDNTNPQ